MGERIGRVRNLLIFFLLSTWITPVFSRHCDISTNPQNPRLNENFEIIFRCEVEGSKEPDIKFSVKGIQVGRKQFQGVSTRSIYNNGEISVHREFTYSYRAAITSKNDPSLKNISIGFANKTQKIAKYSIGVNNSKEQGSAYVHVVAEVSKNQVYLNEGITVRYYLYLNPRVDLRSFDIKEYPELKDFLKRFLQENQKDQMALYNNQRYRKSLIYSARLYPNKVGEFVVDSLVADVSYSESRALSFGFSVPRGGVKNATLSSEPVKIKVKELPQEGKPKSFNGLIGAHQFELIGDKAKLLVNQPFDLRLVVRGEGGLERWESPDFYQEGLLSVFDKKSDFKISSAETAEKVVTYTFLAEKAGDIASKKVEISYFDPLSEKYFTKELSVPGVSIRGSSVVSAQVSPKNPARDSLIEEAYERENLLLGPVAQVRLWEKPKYFLALFLILFGLVFGHFVIREPLLAYVTVKSNRTLINGKTTYADLVRTFSPLNGIEQAAKMSSLDEREAQEIIDFWRNVEKSQFSSAKKDLPLKLERSLVNRLNKILRSLNDEGNSIS